MVIARAKEAGVLRQDFEVDDIRTMMCGLGSMMAADARGVMSYDWRRQLDLFLDGIRTSAVATSAPPCDGSSRSPSSCPPCCVAGMRGRWRLRSALDSALSYLPKDAPFAVAIDTDLDGDQYKALQASLEKFPFGGQIKDSLRQQLEQGSNVDFDDDVKPVLGNPFVVGGTDAPLFTGAPATTPFVAPSRPRTRARSTT